MKTLFTSLFLLIGLSYCLTQQINLTGQISIHNSRYRTGQIEYVANAFISAPFAGSTNTDSEGLFGLTFQGIEGGTVIKLTVEKAGLEVVNTYDLERVVLGQKPRLPIYLAPKGRLAEAQTELYNISKKALFARRDAIIAHLRGEKVESDAALAELEHDWGIEIGSIGEAMQLLDSKIEELQKRLPKFAQEMAAKNLDFASELYIQAYELFQAGDIEGAISVLGEARLEQSYQEALASIEKGKSLEEVGRDLQEKGKLQIEQVVESYRLKAKGHNLLFAYREAAKAQQKIVDILEASTDDETLELADAYGALGSTLQDLGEYTKALAVTLKNTTIKEQLLADDDQELATSYNNLSLIYQDLGDYETALAVQQKAIIILEQALDPNHTNISASYNNLAGIYLNFKAFEAALNVQQKAITILEQALEPNQISIATSYNNLAVIYRGLKDYKAALAVQQKAIIILEQALDPNHINIATSHNNLALIYHDLGEYGVALVHLQKTITIQEQVLELNHPSIGISYNNLAQTNIGLNNFKAASAAQRNAIAIFEQVLDAHHPSIATCYHNLSNIYYKQDQLDSAIIYENRAYSIWQKKLPKDHPNLEISRGSLASLYTKRAEEHRASNEYRQAIADYEKAVEFSDEKAELYFVLGLSHFFLKNYLQAIESYEKCYQNQGINEKIYLHLTGVAYAKLGKLVEAESRFEQLEEVLPNNSLPYQDWGLFYSLKDEYDNALDNLEKAIQLGYNNWEWLRTEAALDPLRDHPRFKALLSQAPDEKE